MKVFIAEESEKLRKRLIHMINRLTGLPVFGEEGDAHKTIQAIRQLKPDVVILSMQLSNGTALDVLKNIIIGKEDPEVILLVDQVHTMEPTHYKKYGIKQIFNKALQLEELVNALRKINDDHLENH